MTSRDRSHDRSRDTLITIMRGGGYKLLDGRNCGIRGIVAGRDALRYNTLSVYNIGIN